MAETALVIETLIPFNPSSRSIQYQELLAEEKGKEAAEAKHRQGQPKVIVSLTDFYLVNPEPEPDGIGYRSVEIEYTINYHTGIRRTRRITGYLSEMTNFNPAKSAELRDRMPFLIGNAEADIQQDTPPALANTITAGSGRRENMSIENRMFAMAQMQRELEGV